MDPKKVRKKEKRKYKFDQLRRLKTLRQIKKYGAVYHGIDTTKDFKSSITLVDDSDDEEIDKFPAVTEDDLYYDGLKKRDLYNEDYTDVDVDEIRSETYKMEQIEQAHSVYDLPEDRNADSTKTQIDSHNVTEFGADFASLGIGTDLVTALHSKGITEPTDIQRKVIPNLLSKFNLIEDINIDSPFQKSEDVLNSKSSAKSKKIKNQKSKSQHIVELTVFGERTGTGKTLGYLLPILEAIKRDTERLSIPLRMNRPRAIVLAPTRELCEQIRRVIVEISQFMGVSSCVLTAGTSTRNQLKKLRTGVDIIVGTPQRIKEHIDISSGINPHSQNVFSLVDTRYVVMDEGDVLLNEGFWENEMMAILGRVGCFKASEVELKNNTKVKGGMVKVSKVSKYSKPIQLVLCSATMTPQDIATFCDHLGLHPGIKMIDTESLHCILPAMNMYFWSVLESKNVDKLQTLRMVLRQEQILWNQRMRANYKSTLDETYLVKQLEKPRDVQFKNDQNIPSKEVQSNSKGLISGDVVVPQQTIIFCKTKSGAAAVSHFLDESNFENVLFFGVHSPFERKDKFTAFLRGESTILVATDVAMRGLDISSVSHVILYDFPHSPRAFIHRVGRTGRINTVSDYEGNQCKITALIDKHDSFMAAAILTAMNDGKSVIDLIGDKRKYKAFPHLKLKTAASHLRTNNGKLVPFEPMPVRLLSAAEIEEKKKIKKMGKHYKAWKRKHETTRDLDHPRMWWYSNRVGKTRTPFYNIRKRIVKKLLRQRDEDERRKLLLKFTTERKALPGGWSNTRNRRRIKKPHKFADL